MLDRKDGVREGKRPSGQALSYTDARLQMPPSGKLPDAVIADFEKWIAGGNADAGAACHRAGSPAGHGL